MALEQLLNQSASQVGVMPINWSQLIATSALTSPFFANLTDSLALKVKQSEFYARLEAAKIGDRRKLLSNHITSQVAQVLGQKLSQTLDLDQGFFELGMDSLMTVELRNRLQNSLGCSLPSTLVFDYPTITKLTDYLAENAISLEFDDKLPLAVQQENTKNERLNQLEALSQDEIADLLAQKLLSIRNKKPNE
ncbi:polyketide synthase [Microseira wollei NIES-4236]|uniref:Polyketide synthase n=1 Tax=Microseira wollei NIES-4236 TaxID=2530354 RepID=A0AAV3XR96_9CYAN|nr:polyketide synthase [Microseira wollei NIES-4236]